MSSCSVKPQSLQSYIIKTLSLISPVDAINVKKIRVGGAHDGGYVMLDDIDRVTICYSLGIGPDVSWDENLAGRGAVIYQYDHTVDGPPIRHENFRFSKTGITHDEHDNANMRTIGSIVADNDHLLATSMLMKIDIEGAEWDILAGISHGVLDRFSQIVVEFHGLRLLAADDFRERADRVFRRMNATHRVVHVHGNNFGGVYFVEGVSIPDVMELTFVRRATYEFTSCKEVFPTSIDAPCNANIPDIFLGSFRFL